MYYANDIYIYMCKTLRITALFYMKNATSFKRINLTNL